MRTTDEIRQWIGTTPDAGTFGYMNALDIAHGEGFDAGMTKALKMIQEGKSTDDILNFTRADEQSYHSYGNDQEDAWQSGYSTALYWCAEQYDWDEQGNVLFRPGNIFNEPAFIEPMNHDRS